MARLRVGQGTSTAQRRWQALDRRERRYLRAAWANREGFSCGIVVTPVEVGLSEDVVPEAISELRPKYARMLKRLAE